MYFFGSLMTIFVTSVEQLMITFSVFQGRKYYKEDKIQVLIQKSLHSGAGFGFMIPVAYTTFNHYFIDKRVLMMSVAQSLIGVGTMFYPILVQFLMDKYGFRGSMAVISAFNAHAIFGMLVMHPIDWHYNIVKIPVDESKPRKQFFDWKYFQLFV